MKASIIVTTRNRAADLRRTLESLGDVRRPEGLELELLLVDNASSDDTPAVINACRTPGFTVRPLREPQPGQARARNLGLNQSTGDFVLFLDDDVRPRVDWLEQMISTLMRERPCAVAGGVVIAPELLRSWMTGLHRSWLASSEWINPESPDGMVGANMAFSREVLLRVPQFDPDLGPGTSGFSDDQLFAWQVLEAGYRIVAHLAAEVEHHFDPRRLQRASWLDAALRRGQSHAYCGHHWMHWTGHMVRPRLARATLALRLWQFRHAANRAPAEGCSEHELQLRYRYSLFRSHLAQLQAPRLYDRRGLVKRAVARVGSPSVTGGTDAVWAA